MIGTDMVYFSFFWFFIISTGITNGQSDDFVELNITDGRILGTKGYTAGKNMSYFNFQGIPYAKPPVDDLRFRPSVPVKPWNGTLNCTYEKSQCVQGSDPVTGSEDCLTINVYTPSLTSKLAVLIHIHGGSFTSQNSSKALQPPDNLIEEGVVFAAMNYRLGVFGFLSTEDLECPGNLGLKDQVLALKWVQKNIHYFGGDPNNVTIFGQSSGAVSVHYHMLSKMSVGLFHKTIMNSGTSLCLYSRARDSRNTAFLVGTSLGILTSNTTVLVRELRKVAHDDLQKVASRVDTLVFINNVLDGLTFAPVKEIEHDGAFFSGNSEDTLQKGNYTKVPSLLGFNSREMVVLSLIPGIVKGLLFMDDISTQNLAPKDLSNNYINRALAATLIRTCYFSRGSISLATDEELITFLDDDQFYRAILRTAALQSQYADTYLYKFDYLGPLGSPTNRTMGGVGHTEELAYLFNINSGVSRDDESMRIKMSRMYANFAKYGNPTPIPDPLLNNVTWTKTQLQSSIFLNISSNLKVSTTPITGCILMYNTTIYPKYGDSPHDTY